MLADLKMQKLERVFGFQKDDFTSLPANLTEAANYATNKYKRETSQKLRMVDALICLSLATFLLQVVYGVLVCRDPFNSFIAGVFCSMGIFALTMSFRLQLTSQEFKLVPARLLFEYILGCLALFFACFLLMG